MGEYLVVMGDKFGGADGSDGEKVGGRCEGGTNSVAYGERAGGDGAGTAVLGGGLEAAGGEW